MAVEPARLSAALAEAISIIITPLISLAKDQIDNWNDRGTSIDARAFNCTVSESEKSKVLRDVAAGEPMLLYTTPESLVGNALMQEAIKVACDAGNLCCIAVDEAHCVSQWGHDFRPSYLALKQLRELLKHSFNRPNIKYICKYKDAIALSASDLKQEHISEGVARDISDFIVASRNSGIIYARTREQCEQLGRRVNDFLVEADCEECSVAHYHAGLGQSDRGRIQQQWQDGAIVAVVATTAFGMGIDKSDIRWVIHYCMSGSMEGFAQESGRAGRDGAPSLSMLYTSPADIDWCMRICKPQERPKVGAMVEFASTVRCRRAKLLTYFDEKNGRCKEGVDELCDVCTSAAAVQKMQVKEAVKEGGSAKASKPAAAWHKIADPSVPVNLCNASSISKILAEDSLCEPRFPEEKKLVPLLPTSTAVMPGRLPLHAPRKHPSGTTRASDPKSLGAKPAQQTRNPGHACHPPQLSLVRSSHAGGKRKFVPPRAMSDKEV